MKTELYKLIKGIGKENLTNDDLEELLLFFMVTKNDLIRNQIAFIFADLHFTKAVPYIFKKINDKEIFQNTGSLVYCLASFDLKRYFIELVKIICLHEFESRLTAFGIIQDYLSSVSKKVKANSIEILEKHRIRLEQIDSSVGENSALHFVEKTKEMILDSMSI